MKVLNGLVLLVTVVLGPEVLADVGIRYVPPLPGPPVTAAVANVTAEVPPWLKTICFLILMNGIAFGMFAWDKWRSRNGGWRVPESNLLLAAAVGGSVGAIAAQQWLRHKTHKEPFRRILYGIAVVHGLVLLATLSG